MVAILTTPPDVESLRRQLSRPESGAIDLFLGVVRNHSDGRRVDRIEYTAYGPMAERQLSLIERAIRARWTVREVVLVHRVGVLGVGDVAVVVGVSADHRADACEACRFGIENVKAEVPIWKKEYTEDGAAWVEPAGAFRKT